MSLTEPTEPGVIVVGAGTAASECVIRVRNLGYTGSIRMIGAETHLPYHRPPLSKAFLAGEIEHAGMLIRPDTAYERANVIFQGGTWVDGIDRAAHTVHLRDGTTIPYAKLVLATGGYARRMSCPGAELSGVYYLRTLDDVDAIRAQFTAGKRMVIVGGGYVGLEVAAVGAKHGLQVTVIEAAPRVLARVAGQELSAFYESAHRAAGVTILTGASVTALIAAAQAPDHVGAVALADGSHIAADFVLAGIGLIAHTELAVQAGLPIQNGIIVDEYCRTEDPDILAVGDCSNHPSKFLGRRVRLESVPNAMEQGRVAAAAICGKMEVYDAVPWFWSDQYDLKLQAVGISDGYDESILRGNMQDRAFTVFYLRDGALIAADSVNRAAEFMVAKRLIVNRPKLDPALLADTQTPLKTLLAA